MQKSKFLNIVLATAVLVLATLLATQKVPSIMKSRKKAVESVAVKTLDTAFIPFKKRSLGVKAELHPKPAAVIGTYDKDGKPNIMTAAWIGICNSNPLSIAVSMRPATYSYASVTASGAFTVNIPSADLARYVDYAGRFSGKDVDKFKETGLTPQRAEFVNAPFIKEFPLVIECELTGYHDLGSHRQFIGKVIDVKADEDILDAEGRVNVSLLNPLIYAGRNY